MQSRLMQQLELEQRERFAAMAPDERLSMTEQLAREWLRDYMSAHGVTRGEALRALHSSRKLGRKPSRSMAPG